MKRVQWITVEHKCEAFLASDETPDAWAMIPCTATAEVRITYNSGKIEDHCYHHYITRTAFRDRVIEA